MNTYVILVSHGEFAQGLHSALSMFVGNLDHVKSIGLKDGETAEELKQRMFNELSQCHKEDRYLILGDLLGGSPLTTMMDVLAEKQLLEHSVILGGMNLAMALNAVLLKDQDFMETKAMILQEAHEAVKEFNVISDQEDEI